MLSAGIPVVLAYRPGAIRVSVALFIRVGSRFEALADNGLSHFLEHMIYRGNRLHETAHEQALAFERLGSSLYAATATDHGVMTLSLPRETWAEGTRLLAEVVQRPRFSAIDVERRIVHEEILEGLDDDLRDVDPDNLVRALAFGGHPLGQPITGTLDHLAGFDVDRLRAHHRRHYTAANFALSLAGPVRPAEALATLDHAFRGVRPGRRQVPPAAIPPRGDARPRFQYVESDASQTDLRLLFRAPSEHDAREPAVEMLLRIIDDGMSTRLYERVCDLKGLCYAVSAGYETFSDDGAFDFAAETRHDRSVLVVQEILELLHGLRDEGPSVAELDKARDRTVWSFSGMLDSPDDLAAFHGLAELADITRTPADRIDELLSVTRDEVRAATAQVFRGAGLSSVAVGLLPRETERALRKIVRSFD